MSKSYPLTLVLLLLFIQSVVLSEVPDWENCAVIAINKEPAHCTLMPFDTINQANTGNIHQSAYYHSLNGNWKFHWSKDPDSRPVDFYKIDYDTSDWNTIPVPSNWQLQGY